MDGLDASIGALYLDAVTNNPVQPQSVLDAPLWSQLFNSPPLVNDTKDTSGECNSCRSISELNIDVRW